MTAHLMEYKLVGDGRGRSWEEAEEDREWYRAVCQMVSKNAVD